MQATDRELAQAQQQVSCVYVWGEGRERSYMGVVCMLSAELGQAFVWACSNLAPRQPLLYKVHA